MISVIIPTYNRKEILPRAINSVLNQTYQDFEIIIIDDGSTDDTEEMIKTKFNNKKIRYYKLPKNQGVHIARNKGLDITKGEFVIFLDSDDEFYANAFEEIINIFKNKKEVGYIMAPLNMNSKNGELTGFNREKSGYVSYEDLLCGNGLRQKKQCISAFRKEAIGKIRWNVQHLQFIFFRKVAKKTKIFYFVKPLGVYHFLNNSNSVTNVRKVPNEKLSKIRAQELDNFLHEFGGDIIKFCPYKISNYYYGAAVGLLMLNKKFKAIKYAFLSFKYNNKRIKYLVFFLFCLIPFSGKILKLLFKIKKILLNKKI